MRRGQVEGTLPGKDLERLLIHHAGETSLPMGGGSILVCSFSMCSYFLSF